MNHKGALVVFSGPSGSGKGTVLARYLKDHPEAAFSVSATTRQPRPGEVDGVNYWFVTRERFREMIDRGEVLEHTQYNGNYYGSPAGPIRDQLEAGRDVILEIEVDGAMQVRQRGPGGDPGPPGRRPPGDGGGPPVRLHPGERRRGRGRRPAGGADPGRQVRPRPLRGAAAGIFGGRRMRNGVGSCRI